VDISSTCRVGQKLGVSLSLSLSVDMLPFGVTIPVTVPQRSEIPEGLMNYPVQNVIFQTNGYCLSDIIIASISTDRHNNSAKRKIDKDVKYYACSVQGISD
jgi:hypothetical protein